MADFATTDYFYIAGGRAIFEDRWTHDDVVESAGPDFALHVGFVRGRAVEKRWHEEMLVPEGCLRSAFANAHGRDHDKAASVGGFHCGDDVADGRGLSCVVFQGVVPPMASITASWPCIALRTSAGFVASPVRMRAPGRSSFVGLRVSTVTMWPDRFRLRAITQFCTSERGPRLWRERLFAQLRRAVVAAWCAWLRGRLRGRRTLPVRRGSRYRAGARAYR